MPAAREPCQFPQQKVNIDPRSALARTGTPAARAEQSPLRPFSTAIRAGSLKNNHR